MKNGSLILSALFALAIMLASTGAYAYSDQTTTERILKENKSFVEFLNICVTNFAESRKEDLKNAYEKHFNADVAFLQSDYRRAYKRVYASQGEMENLYRDMVKNHYLEDSKSILDQLAPGIIRTKNKRARLYLTLGYRDRTVSWVHYTVGDASNPKLFSYKMYKYVDAIKMARRAKRYAFLALFESQSMEKKKMIYNQLVKMERDMSNRYMNRFVDLNEQNYINEVGRTYEDYEKTESAKSQASGKKEGGKSIQDIIDDKTYEAKVAKRVRFRNETRTARYILNGEFDQAEDIMRKYIEDFNFKLIIATFEVLSAGGSDQKESEKLDYDKMKVHLLDNYSRLARKSLLDELVDTIKVEDDIGDKKQDEFGRDAATGGDTPVEKGTAPTEKSGKEEKEVR
ncbi:MAG: hypothetical protein JW807_09925 [Spirochaetes bacterium]|nr:hypothetical protein [Spirochaetota bacterium]